MIEKEEWKVIPGFSDYMISNLGRVKSKKQGLWGYTIRKTQYRSSDGSPYVLLADNGKKISISIHRMVYDLFVGFPADPIRCYIYFKDGNKHNPSIDNLGCEILEVTDNYNGTRRGVKKSSITRERMKVSHKYDNPEDDERRRKNSAYHKEYYKKYYAKNKEYMRERAREYYNNNKKTFKEYYFNRKEWFKEYGEKHKEELKEYRKKYYEEHREKILEKMRERYQKNREEILASMKEKYWRNKNDKTQG